MTTGGPGGPPADSTEVVARGDPDDERDDEKQPGAHGRSLGCCRVLLQPHDDEEQARAEVHDVVERVQPAAEQLVWAVLREALEPGDGEADYTEHDVHRPEDREHHLRQASLLHSLALPTRMS